MVTARLSLITFSPEFHLVALRADGGINRALLQALEAGVHDPPCPAPPTVIHAVHIAVGGETERWCWPWRSPLDVLHREVARHGGAVGADERVEERAGIGAAVVVRGDQPSLMRTSTRPLGTREADRGRGTAVLDAAEGVGARLPCREVINAR